VTKLCKTSQVLLNYALSVIYILPLTAKGLVSTNGQFPNLF